MLNAKHPLTVIEMKNILHKWKAQEKLSEKEQKIIKRWDHFTEVIPSKK